MGCQERYGSARMPPREGLWVAPFSAGRADLSGIFAIIRVIGPLRFALILVRQAAL